jgi:GNAT superfamily N-acetyltransferase
MQIRPATPGDVEQMFDIRCSVRENHQSREELALLGITPATVIEMIECGDYLSFMAEMDGIPVGFAMAQISKQYVFAVFVLPPHEEKGVGRGLMAAVESGLQSCGIRSAWLSTGADWNLRAHKFYRRLGWRADGVLEDGQIVFRKDIVEQSGSGFTSRIPGDG